jgi:hypothetical protein
MLGVGSGPAAHKDPVVNISGTRRQMWLTGASRAERTLPAAPNSFNSSIEVRSERRSRSDASDQWVKSGVNADDALSLRHSVSNDVKYTGAAAQFAAVERAPPAVAPAQPRTAVPITINENADRGIKVNVKSGSSPHRSPSVGAAKPAAAPAATDTTSSRTADDVTAATRLIMQQASAGLLQLDGIQSDAVRRSLRMRSERKALEIANQLDAEEEAAYQQRFARRASLGLMTTTFGVVPRAKPDALLASVEGRHGESSNGWLGVMHALYGGAFSRSKSAL